MMFLNNYNKHRSFRQYCEPQITRTRRELVLIPAELGNAEKCSVTVTRKAAAENHVASSSLTDSTLSRFSASSSAETIDDSAVFVVCGESDDTITCQASQDDNEKQVPHIPQQPFSGQTPRFTRDEIVVGRLLGRGNFCHVKEVRAILKPAQCTEQISCLRNHVVGPHGSYSFAVKRVHSHSSPSSLAAADDDDKKGMDDLYKEAQCLQAIAHHPNIVKLRAMASEQYEHTADFFLVLDRLYDTLAQRIVQWKRAQWPGRSMIAPRGARTFLADRLLVAHDIADAIRFLHLKRVIHRDIKPSNMAFDRVSAVQALCVWMWVRAQTFSQLTFTISSFAPF